MGKKSSDKQRKSLFYKILVLVILLAFSVFLYCAEQDVTPVEALQYLLGQTELDQLPDMPAITDIPHLEELEEWLPEDSPAPSESASPRRCLRARQTPALTQAFNRPAGCTPIFWTWARAAVPSSARQGAIPC